MHGKVLVLDPIATNRILLKVKLAACHYDVLQAGSIGEAMKIISASMPELILTATSLPDGDPMYLLSKMRTVGAAGTVPIIAITSSGESGERLRLLAAGYDDVIEKPVDDALLLARARSLSRAYASASEWKLRDGTSRALGFADPAQEFGAAQKIKLVVREADRIKPWLPGLATRLSAGVELCQPEHVLSSDAGTATSDCFVLVIEPGGGAEMLGLLATIRSNANTRHSAVLVVQTQDDPSLGAHLLDTGANDLMRFQADPSELALRLETLLSRKKLTDALRDTVRSGIEAAVIDPLTGLHNRRYAMPHLARISERAVETGKPFAVLVADMDHFKHINDAYGHAAGDAVLIETAERLKGNLRALDLVARIGGEEFLVVLPGADLDDAKQAATRLCQVVRSAPFDVPGHSSGIDATISIGMTVCDPASRRSMTLQMTPDALLDRADKALYDAKAEGRNRVTLSRPAA